MAAAQRAYREEIRLVMTARKRNRFLFFLPVKIGLAGDRENVIDGDRLHANVVAACALPVVVGVYARATRQLHLDRYRAWRQRAKQQRRFRPERA